MYTNPLLLGMRERQVREERAREGERERLVQQLERQPRVRDDVVAALRRLLWTTLRHPAVSD